MAEANALKELKRKELLTLRERVEPRVRLKPAPKRIRRIAGIDLAFTEQASKVHICASLVAYPRLEVLEEAIATDDIDAYLHGHLGNVIYVPLILSVLKMLKQKYDVVMVRELPFGGALPLSGYVGVIAGRPTIGISPRGGRLKKFARWGSQRRAGAVKIRGHKTPVGVIAGHMVTFKDASALVRGCITESRIPEPVRDAGNRVRAWEREWRRLNIEGR
jgi:deoxyinosine 3'endonuclease (endonuclease V)